MAIQRSDTDDRTPTCRVCSTDSGVDPDTKLCERHEHQTDADCAATMGGGLTMAARGRRNTDPNVFFWPRVSKNPGDGCWNWTGAKISAGYGNLCFRGGWVTTHRFSWELAHGPIPSGLWVLHRCDNPPCVRPDHLFLGSALDNSRDMAEKRRGVTRRGEENALAKLTDAIVIELRRRAAAGESRSELAREFRVDRNNLLDAVYGRSWSHVPGALPRNERGNAKLTDAQVLELRARAARGESRSALAREYAVARNQIISAVYGHSFAHLGGALTPPAARTKREAA